MTDGERQLSSVSLSDRGHIMAYAATDAVSPTELYVARGDGTAERQASEFNEDWMDGITLMPSERITWMVGDSVEVGGMDHQAGGLHPWRQIPADPEDSRGPHSGYGNTFFPTFHVLSSAGFLRPLLQPPGVERLRSRVHVRQPAGSGVSWTARIT